MLQKHRYKIALLISILLHILVIWFYKPLAEILRLVPDTHAESEITEPLVFEFEQPQRPNEVIETPESARVDQPPDDAQFLSDKNAQAQDMYTANDLAPGLSYSEGDLDYKLFAGQFTGQTNMGEQQQAHNLEEQEETGEDDRHTELTDPFAANPEEEPLVNKPGPGTNLMRPKFSKDLLFGSESTAPSGMLDYTDNANWDNRNSNAANDGGISLSTYEWNYAPYIQYMKKEFQKHFYPPAALYQLGIIEGYVTVNYKVQRDGTIAGLELVENKGHSSLVATTLSMIKASSPLKPLPGDFPDNNLGIQFTFLFTIQR